MSVIRRQPGASVASGAEERAGIFQSWDASEVVGQVVLSSISSMASTCKSAASYRGHSWCDLEAWRRLKQKQTNNILLAHDVKEADKFTEGPPKSIF